MKAIKITDERMAEVLPAEIKNTDVLSNNAKKTLATIMNYFAILNIAKSSKYLVCPNSVLRTAVGIRNNDLIIAVQELIDCDLIERQVGHKRVEGEKATASVYKVIWENLTKPIKKKNTFEELFSEFLKSSGTPLGTTDADADIDTVTDTDIENDIEVENDIDAASEIEDEVIIDNEVEIENQFEIDKEILLNKIEEATDGLDFNAIESVKIPLNNFITSTFSNEIDRLKRILYNTLEKKKEKLKDTILEEAMSLPSTVDELPF